MENLAKLIADDLQDHHRANTLHASTRRTRATADDHTEDEGKPRDMGPFGSVVAEEARGRDEGDHLEDTTAEGALQVVVVVPHQFHHDKQGAGGDDEEIEAKLVVAEELFYAKAGHGSIEHREIDARKEAEERTDIFLCRGAEGGNGSALRGETSCGRTGEGVVDGIKPAHTA